MGRRRIGLLVATTALLWTCAGVASARVPAMGARQSAQDGLLLGATFTLDGQASGTETWQGGPDPSFGFLTKKIALTWHEEGQLGIPLDAPNADTTALWEFGGPHWQFFEKASSGSMRGSASYGMKDTNNGPDCSGSLGGALPPTSEGAFMRDGGPNGTYLDSGTVSYAPPMPGALYTSGDCVGINLNKQFAYTLSQLNEQHVANVDTGGDQTATFADTVPADPGYGGGISWSAKLTITPKGGSYAALGDSYSSGDGAVTAGQREPAYSDNCHRTPDSYPMRVGLTVNDVACSGSKIIQIDGAELGNISHDAAVVTVTAGGNDISVFARAKECFLTPLAQIVLRHSLLNFGGCAKKLAQEVAPELAALPARLENLYIDIHRWAPKAQLLVLGYPNPFPAKLKAECESAKPQGSIHHVPLALLGKVYRKDIPAFYRMILELNQAVEHAVSEVSSPTFSPSFLPTNGPDVPNDLTFDGHDICGSDPWLWGLRTAPFPTPSTLHPNIAGNRAMAAIIRDYLDSEGLTIPGS